MLMLTVLVLGFSACQKDNISSDIITENFTEIDLRDNEETNGSTCYEYNYPIVLELADGETVTIEGKEAMKEFAQEWRESNPGTKKTKNPVTGGSYTCQWGCSFC